MNKTVVISIGVVAVAAVAFVMLGKKKSVAPYAFPANTNFYALWSASNWGDSSGNVVTAKATNIYSDGTVATVSGNGKFVTPDSIQFADGSIWHRIG